MCLIIDANKINNLVEKPEEPDHRPIHDWLEKQRGRIATGGRNLEELTVSAGGKRFIAGLLKAGKAWKYEADVISTKERELADSGILQSDDEHVLALSIVSGARCLFSDDRDLCDDFRNPRIISRPRGKVYRRDEHQHLLRNAPKCRQPQSSG